MNRLTAKDQVDIVRAYQTDLMPMVELAGKYKITRQGIHKILKRMGVNTSKCLGNTRLSVSCTVCGNETVKHRMEIRKFKHHFCSESCYCAWLKHGNGNPSIVHRNSGRVARTIVSQYFSLEEKHIVHHEDRNQYDNRLSNLRVFANQGDHVKYHRDIEVPILWDGSKI